ncbi:MAG: hypothetical protein KAY08_01790 [Giesbergeria sp.]|nr:hypothetical protein [Giesbergeria sp.]
MQERGMAAAFWCWSACNALAQWLGLRLLLKKELLAQSVLALEAILT